MTALLCIDTATRLVRRYTPQVHAGVRRARCTHEYLIEQPQEDTLPQMLERFRSNTFPGMNAPAPAAA